MTTLDLWAPYLTSKIRDQAVDRILRGGNLAARTDLTKPEIKLVLIAVLNMNPLEILSTAEAAIVYGCSENTVANKETAGSLSRKLNRGK